MTEHSTKRPKSDGSAMHSTKRAGSTDLAVAPKAQATEQAAELATTEQAADQPAAMTLPEDAPTAHELNLTAVGANAASDSTEYAKQYFEEFVTGYAVQTGHLRAAAINAVSNHRNGQIAAYQQLSETEKRARVNRFRADAGLPSVEEANAKKLEDLNTWAKERMANLPI